MLHRNNIQYTEFRHRGILRQFIFCSQIILPISPRRTIYRARPMGGDWWGKTNKRDKERKRKRERKRENVHVCMYICEIERKGGIKGEDREKRWREVMVGGRVILLLMCVTRSTRPRTHHHRDNRVGGSRRRDAGWFGARSTGGSQQKPPLNDPAPSCTTIKSS